MNEKLMKVVNGNASNADRKNIAESLLQSFKKVRLDKTKEKQLSKLISMSKMDAASLNEAVSELTTQDVKEMELVLTKLNNTMYQIQMAVV
mgnify:CR=1 FL=1